MDYVIIFSVISLLLLVALFARVVKGLLKGFFLVSMTLTLIMAVTSYFIYVDAADFQQGWETKPKLFLLEDKDYLVSGFKVDPDKNETGPIPVEALKNYRESFSVKNYDKVLDGNHRLFIIDLEAFNGVSGLNILNKDLTLEQVKSIINSGAPNKEFTKLILGQEMEIKEDPEKDDMLRSTLFAGIFAKAMQERGTFFIIEEVKNQNIRVYPEGAMFKMLRLIPIGFIKQALAESAEAGKEAVTAAAAFGVRYIKNHKGEIYGIL